LRSEFCTGAGIRTDTFPPGATSYRFDPFKQEWRVAGRLAGDRAAKLSEGSLGLG